MIPVENYPNLYRDEKTGAIINTDSSAYSNYIKLKNAKLAEKDEIAKLKTDVEEIKTLLQQLVLNNQKELQ